MLTRPIEKEIDAGNQQNGKQEILPERSLYDVLVQGWKRNESLAKQKESEGYEVKEFLERLSQTGIKVLDLVDRGIDKLPDGLQIAWEAAVIQVLFLFEGLKCPCGQKLR